MSLSRSLLAFTSRLLRFRQKQKPRREAKDPRILVIRRNRMGDMIYTLPLLHALRRHFPEARITVACDPLGEPIARACAAVNEVIVLKTSWSSWSAIFKNAGRLQNFDWVIAAKGGFDRRLASLARLTNTAMRIGFEKRGQDLSHYYTDPIAPPEERSEEHQIDTLMRLLKPLGLVRSTAFSVNLSLRIPDASEAFAQERLSKEPFAGKGFVLINFSSTVGIKLREEDFIELARRILAAADLSIGFVAAPLDQQKAQEIAFCMGSRRVEAIDTTGPLDLAALLAKASFLLTPEGGAAHLAAAVGTPAVVIWSEGPFKKWYSRGKRHSFVHAEAGETLIPIDRIWQAVQPFLYRKYDALDSLWAQALEPPARPGSKP